MTTRIWISQLEFSDNTTISFDKEDIVVLVGPNNAGKSASLKECASLLKSKNKPKNKVIKKLVSEKTGDEAELITFLESTSRKYFNNNEEPYFQGYGYNVYSPHAKSWWENSSSNGMGDLFHLFVSILNTEERLKTANPADNIKLTSEPITHPIHFLQKNDDLEKRFSGYVKQAFGKDLIVHRNAGKVVPLYVGEKPTIQNGEDRVSIRYVQELEKLDLLNEQGDGMRSFVGVLLNAFISNHSILFIVNLKHFFIHPKLVC